MDTELSSDLWNKRKIFAVLFAIFLGPCTWLYTHRKDSWKASLGLGVTVSLIVFVVYESIIMFVAPISDFIGIIGWFIVLLAILFLMWLSAVIDTVLKKKDWFKSRYTRRSKKVAVFLAVCVGPWTWLYTYPYDTWKFWVGLVIGYGFLISSAITDEAYFLDMWLFGSLTVWIISIINSAIRDNYFYENVSTGYLEQPRKIMGKRTFTIGVISWSIVIIALVSGFLIHYS